MAGLLDKPESVSHLDPLAFFNHPAILDVQGYLFGEDNPAAQYLRSRSRNQGPD